jgi:hypothetical protein
MKNIATLAAGLVIGIAGTGYAASGNPTPHIHWSTERVAAGQIWSTQLSCPFDQTAINGGAAGIEPQIKSSRPFQNGWLLAGQSPTSVTAKLYVVCE